MIDVFGLALITVIGETLMKQELAIKIIISVSAVFVFAMPAAFAQRNIDVRANTSVRSYESKRSSESASIKKVKEAEMTKDVNQKLVLLSEAIQLNPKNDQAYVRRAVVLKEMDEKAMKQQNYSLVDYKTKAIEDIEKAIALNPAAENYLMGSFVYYSVRYNKDKKEYDKIQKKYAKFLDDAIKRHPKEGSLYYDRAALNVNNYDGSVEVDSETVIYHKVFLEDNVHLGKPMTESQIKDYMTFLELNPVVYTDTTSLTDMALGDLLLSYRRGIKEIDLQRLASILDQLIEKNEESPRLRLRRISLNNMLNRPDKNIIDYEKLTEIDSENADAYYALLGSIYYGHKNYEKAIDCYNRSLSYAAYADVYKSRGNAYSQIGEHDKAQQDYKLAKDLEVESDMTKRTIQDT